LSAVRKRTPGLSLGEVFLRAAPEDSDERVRVVAEALEYLQQGFDTHYAGPALDDDVLVGDNAYAWAVETVARLDEPELVAVAARMIQAGSAEIAAGRDVSIQVWVPHLAGLLEVITEEGIERCEGRVLEATRELNHDNQ
jgi:hypothetical protein